MAINYPRKQTFIIFLVCAFAVGAVAVYSNPKLFVKNNVNYGLANANSANLQVETNPIAGTAATDWQKQFLDSKSSDVKLSAQAPKKNSEPLTAIDTISRNFFTRYLELHKGNLSEDERFIENLASQTVDEATKLAKQAKLYTTKDVVLAPSSDANAIRSYANSVGKILVTDSPKKNAMEIAFNAFEKGDMNSLAQIDPITNSYKNMIAKLKATPVPATLAGYHAEILNGFSMIQHLTESLRNISKDPLQAIVALESHTRAQDAVSLSIISVRDIIAKQGITFGSNDYGNVFVNANLNLE